MKPKHRHLLLCAAAAILALLLAAFCEGILFNLPALQHERYHESITKSTSDELTLEFAQERYLKTVTIACQSDTDQRFVVYLQNQAGEKITSSEVTLHAALGSRTVNLMEIGSKVIITPLTELPVGENITITAENSYEWSYIRFLFFLAVFGLAAFLLLGRRQLSEKPENVFTVIALVTGVLLILISGTNQISYDEQTHVAKVWNLSYVGTVYDTDASLTLKTLTAPTFHNLREKEAVADYLDSINRYDTANIFYQTKMVSYEKRGYVPMAVGMAIGRSLGLPFAGIIELSKLCNLLMYTLVCAMAIKYAAKGKSIVAVIALLPNNLFSASQFSYDACVNCFLLLASVLIMNELLEPKRRVKPKVMLAILVCFVIGSYSKQVYILMALMMLFFNYQKFPSKKKAVLFKVALAALCIFMVYEVISPSYTVTTNRLVTGGDSRTEGSGTLGQIYYILGNPIRYTALLLSSMWNKLLGWFTAKDEFLMYAYMGTPGTLWTYIWFAVLLFASLVGIRQEERRSIGTKYIVLNLVMVFGMSAVIWTSLYLSFNVVGSQEIQGVQNRYFAPVFLPVCMCLMNKRFTWKWSRESYYRLIFGVLALIHLYALWKVGIMQYYR